MKTIIEQLKEAGYKFFENQNLYQKRYTDEKGIKYFITYHTGEKFHTSFSVQLYVNDCAINIETVQWFFSENKWNHRVNTLNTVETMVEIIWQSLKADYYEEYNE